MLLSFYVFFSLKNPPITHILPLFIPTTPTVWKLIRFTPSGPPVTNSGQGCSMVEQIQTWISGTLRYGIIHKAETKWKTITARVRELIPYICISRFIHHVAPPTCISIRPPAFYTLTRRTYCGDMHTARTLNSSGISRMPQSVQYLYMCGRWFCGEAGHVTGVGSWVT